MNPPHSLPMSRCGGVTILLAVSLEFRFGFAKTVDWWAGLVAGPAALATLGTLFRLRRTHAWLVRAATWVVRGRLDTTERSAAT